MRLRISARCAAGVAAAAFLLGLSVRPAHAANILITQFDNQFNGATDVYAQMAATLQADGHTTSIVDARVDGALAAALGGGTFDSVFLWDLTASLYLDGADLTALAGFYGTHSSLVIDTRSYGYYFQGTQPSEVNLLQNVAANLTLAGGGSGSEQTTTPVGRTTATPSSALSV